MKGVTIAVLVVTLCLSAPSPPAMAQDVSPAQIVKGELLSINGQVYLVRDLSGRFVRVRVDKDTKRERLIVPGEKIEAQIASDGHALSVKPTP